jgi:hypothetical protein
MKNLLAGIVKLGYAVEQLVEALHYKQEGRGFDYRWGLFQIYHGLTPSGPNMALRSTQPLTEMSTRDFH